MVIFKKKEGYSLVELLVAMFIFVVLLLGLLAGLLLAYDISVRNLARDEAVKIAQEFSEKYRSMKFENVHSENASVTRQIRNSNITYNVSSTVTDELAGEIKRVLITVTWNYKGKNYSYQLETLLRRE
ncbi:prepilin-type N-terminal cleavage/methylation domain-containing protein [Persephonella sp.]